METSACKVLQPASVDVSPMKASPPTIQRRTIIDIISRDHSNLYVVLGVTQDLPEAETRTAMRRLLVLTHSDKNSFELAKEALIRFLILNDFADI